jgi:hypothetical protein
MVEERASVEGLMALPANKTIRVPLIVKSRNIVFHNGAAATTALGSEHIKIVVPTVWLSFALMKTFFSKLLAALSTKEVLRMPRLF